ncbi:hypothetical protein FSP39_015780 [Pinctada imbricata]|uniref:Uncharacterized protein n=1 Tax=Pinctada imbricata TaxID=66713 RepID=A0AA88YDE8_PINIB|nr:hypothetical protein FSP39_015780 [Pinctada imbricata]
MSKYRDMEVRHRSVSTNTSTQSPIDRCSSLEKTYEIVVTGKEKDEHTRHGFMEDERKIYEQQLTQLQDQLEAVMIEKENIASQLKHVKTAKEKLQQRNFDLEKHLETRKDLRESVKHKESDSQSPLDSTSASSKYPSWMTGIVERMISSVYQLADDFKTKDQLSENGEDEGEPLTAKR